MSFNDFFQQLWLYFLPHAKQVLLTALLIFVYFSLTRFILPKVEASVAKSRLRAEAGIKAAHAIRIVGGILVLALLLLIWGVDFHGLLLLSTSLLTLTGVALFATWSLLSNITAYFVLLFHVSFRRGNFIRIVDADNFIEGYIAEIGVFNTRLITEDREVIVYPNNVLIVRPVLVNPRDRLGKIGKITNSDKPIVDKELSDTAV